MRFIALKNHRNVWLYDRYILPQSQEMQIHFGNLIYRKVTTATGYFVCETLYKVWRESHACDLTWRLASFDIACISNHPGSHLNRGTAFSISNAWKSDCKQWYQNRKEKSLETVVPMSLLEVSPDCNYVPVPQPPSTSSDVRHQWNPCLSCSRYVIQLRNLVGDSRSWRNPNPQEAWCIKPFAT